MLTIFIIMFCATFSLNAMEQVKTAALTPQMLQAESLENKRRSMLYEALCCNNPKPSLEELTTYWKKLKSSDSTWNTWLESPEGYTFVIENFGRDCCGSPDSAVRKIYASYRLGTPGAQEWMKQYLKKHPLEKEKLQKEKFYRLMREATPEFIQYLLNIGLSFGDKNDNQQTWLMSAAFEKRENVIRMFVESAGTLGIDIYAKDIYDNSVLTIALRNNLSDSVALLVANGVPLSETDKEIIRRGRLTIPGLLPSQIQRAINPENGELAILEDHTSCVLSVCFSPDGKKIASGACDNTVKIWDIESKSYKTLRGHTEFVLSVCFNSKGNLLASCSLDNTIRLWEVTTGLCLMTLTWHTGPVMTVAFGVTLSFGPADTLVSGSRDGTLIIWDVKSGDRLYTVKDPTYKAELVCFSGDGKMFVTRSKGFDTALKLWDITELYHLLKHRKTAEQGKCDEAQYEDLVDRGWCKLALKELHGGLGAVCISPDGKLIASYNYKKLITLWEVSDGSCVKTSKGHDEVVTGICFSPDSALFATCSNGRTIKLWNPATGECLRTIVGHTDGVHTLSFSPDGKILASGSGDNAVRLWDVSVGLQGSSKEKAIVKAKSPENGHAISTTILIEAINGHKGS